MTRQRGRNRGGGQGGKPQQNVNRAFDSNGPDNVKIRGHAQHVFEKYSALARDAFSGGDRVLAENYMQHAEHYFRTLRAISPNKPASEIAARDSFTSGFDIDFEDEALETAMEEADAQAAERAAGGGQTGSQANAQGGGSLSAQGDDGDRQNGERQNERQNNYEGRRDRWRDDRSGGERQTVQNGDRSNGDRQASQNGQSGEFRRDRYDRDRQGGEARGNGDFRRDQNRDRDASRDQNRDQPRDASRDGGQDRGAERNSDRGEFRRDRGERPDRQDRWGSDRQGASESDARVEAPAASAVEPPPSVMLRSRDGEESHAPAFLGASTPAVPASAPARTAATEDAPPRRTRTRRRPAEDTTPAPETEEA